MTLYTGFPAQNKQQRPPPLFCILFNACLLFRHELQLSDAVCLAYWPRAAGCPSFCLTHLHLRLGICRAKVTGQATRQGDFYL